METQNAIVGIIMGSQSDLPVLHAAAAELERFKIPFEITIVSAHRTPERMVDYAKSARQRGLKVIIAGAGGAAHLPGMVASLTTLPVIGVPVKSSNSINGAANAGILAAQIVSISDQTVAARLETFKADLASKVIDSLHAVENLNYTHICKSIF
jgi:5-(carboxyamino)imidazole ribonucleotide mutase